MKPKRFPLFLPLLTTAVILNDAAAGDPRQPLIPNDELDGILAMRQPPKKPQAAASQNGCPSFLNLSVEKNGTRAVLSLYDEISYWSGNDAATFRAYLSNLNVETIELRINSPGGSVFEGVAIYNILIAHPARIEVHIDGLAASIASLIALAGDERHTAENALWMIHDPLVAIRGNAREIRKIADVLDKIKDSMLNSYASVTGLDRAEISKLMEDETYFTAAEALEKGFSTHTTAPLQVAALWTPTEDMPENVRAFGKPETPTTPPPPPNPEPTPEPTPTPKGTVEDVKNAAALIANLRQQHALT